MKITHIAKDVSIRPLTITNPKTGKVHEFYSVLLDDPTDGPEGRTKCGVEIFEGGWEVGQDKITCQNCLNPGHDNLWSDVWENDWRAY